MEPFPYKCFFILCLCLSMVKAGTFKKDVNAELDSPDGLLKVAVFEDLKNPKDENSEKVLHYYLRLDGNKSVPVSNSFDLPLSDDNFRGYGPYLTTWSADTSGFDVEGISWRLPKMVLIQTMHRHRSEVLALKLRIIRPVGKAESFIYERQDLGSFAATYKTMITNKVWGVPTQFAFDGKSDLNRVINEGEDIVKKTPSGEKYTLLNPRSTDDRYFKMDEGFKVAFTYEMAFNWDKEPSRVCQGILNFSFNAKGELTASETPEMQREFSTAEKAVRPGPQIIGLYDNE